MSIEIDTSGFAAAVEREYRAIVAGCARAVTEAVAAGESAAKVTAPHRSYELRNSIRGQLTSTSDKGAEGEIEATAPHANFVYRGTSAHYIEPRRKKALRFEQDGAIRFAKRVYHPGTNANPGFMEIAATVAERKVSDVMRDVIRESVARLNR